MSGYFWVAVGGALGSMARYWMTGFVAMLAGPEFPWGTILINILGSAVIGFFGTFTGPEGNVTVPADARLFVMVGLCGGFTTFSSFSLQTLNLARGGEFLSAGWNIAVSVVVCLLAVWIGHVAAAGLNAAR